MKEPSEERKGPSGERIKNPKEILYRQVHPQWIEGGRTTSMAFWVNARSAWTPNSRDEGLLSVSQGSLIGAEEAYQFHVRKVRPDGKRLESGGVWGVYVSECEEARLIAYDDPVSVNCLSQSGDIEEVEDQAHAVINFHKYPRKKYKVPADKLRRHANERGPEFMPTENDEDEGEPEIQQSLF